MGLIIRHQYRDNSTVRLDQIKAAFESIRLPVEIYLWKMNEAR